MKLLELFAGIGSQYRGLTNIGIDIIESYISEIDKICLEIYPILNNHTPTNLGNIKDIIKIPDVDILTYSFPCQDISVMGSGKGLYDSERSSLLWEVGRILKTNKLPNDLLMENVSAITNKNHIQGLNEWMKLLESLGYTNYLFKLNAKDFGVPQNRVRTFMVSRLKGDFIIPIPINLNIKLKDIIETNVDERFYRDSFLPFLDKNTMTLSNIKWSFDKIIYDENGISQCILHTTNNIRYKILTDNRIRVLTPLEKMRLMGYTTDDYIKIKNYTDNQITSVMGNSIVVPVLESIFRNLKY